MINGTTGKQIYLAALGLVGLMIIATSVVICLGQAVPGEFYLIMLSLLTFVTGTQINPASPNTHTVITKEVTPDGQSTATTSVSSSGTGSAVPVSGDNRA